MNTLPLLPLNELYRHYLDVYFHASQLSEPRLTRSEFERALHLLPVKPVNIADAESWLNCFSPAWLRGEPEAEPFPENTEANHQWREAQRTPKEKREAAVRDLLKDNRHQQEKGKAALQTMVELAEDMRLYDAE